MAITKRTCVGIMTMFSLLTNVAKAESNIGTWAGEPRLEIQYDFGGHGASTSGENLSISFGYASRLHTYIGDRLPGNQTLPISGLTYRSTSGIAPMILGVIPQPKTSLAANGEEESSISWPWIIGGATAVAAVLALIDDEETTSDNPPDNGGNDSGLTSTILGPGDSDGQCDIASGPSATNITVIEQDCLN